MLVSLVSKEYQMCQVNQNFIGTTSDDYWRTTLFFYFLKILISYSQNFPSYITFPGTICPLDYRISWKCIFEHLWTPSQSVQSTDHTFSKYRNDRNNVVIWRERMTKWRKMTVGNPYELWRKSWKSYIEKR